MANKAFEIQESKLRIGGLDLEAGATAIAIPGLSQAATYFVEEVDERDGSNPSTFGSNASGVTVIDNSRYLALSGTTASSSYIAAEYSVDELDDGKIDEINVETAGVFESADKTRAEAGNMWATTVANPFVSFNAGDWTQIPYRPKVRAGEITNIGGGGGASNLADLDDVALESPSNGQVLMWNNSQEKWQNQSLSGGTDLGDFTIDGNELSADQMLIFTNSGNLTVQADGNAFVKSDAGSKEWKFDNSGNLKLPAGGDIVDSTGASVLGGGGGGGATNQISSGSYNVTVNSTGVISMATGRGGIEFGAMPEVGGPEHLHIMRPAGQNGSTDLFFGDDYNYVKLPGLYSSNPDSQQGVEIGSSLDEGTVSKWQFKTNGDLQLPAGGDIVNSSGTSVLGGGGINNHIEYTDSETDYTSTLNLDSNFRVDLQHSHADFNGDGTWNIGSGSFDTKIFSTDNTTPDPKDIVVRANNNDWTFNSTGGLVFPDGSTQTTAYVTAQQYGYFNELVHTGDNNRADMEAVAMDSDGNSYISYSYYDDSESKRYGGIIKFNSLGVQQWSKNILSGNVDAGYVQIVSLEYVVVSSTPTLLALGNYGTNTNDVGFTYFIDPADGSIIPTSNIEFTSGNGMRIKDGVFSVDPSGGIVNALVVGETYDETLQKTFTPLAPSTIDKLYVSWTEFNASEVQSGSQLNYTVGGYDNVIMNGAFATASPDGTGSGLGILVSAVEGGTYNIIRDNGWSGVINGWTSPQSIRVLGSNLGGIDNVKYTAISEGITINGSLYFEATLYPDLANVQNGWRASGPGITGSVTLSNVQNAGGYWRFDVPPGVTVLPGETYTLDGNGNDFVFDFNNTVFAGNSNNINAAVSNKTGTPVSDVFCSGSGGKDWSTEIGNLLSFEYQLNNQAFISRVGGTSWSKNIGFTDDDRLHSVVVDTSSGDNYAVGYMWNGNNRGSLVIKHDIAGNQEWAVYVDPANNTGGHVTSVDLLADGNIITVDENGTVTKIDSSDGSIIWQVTIDSGPSWNNEFRGTATPDGGYILISDEDNDDTLYVARISGNDGSVEWTKRITRTFGGNTGEIRPQNDYDAQYIDCNSTHVTIAANSYLNGASPEYAGIVINFPIDGENTDGIYGQYVISSVTLDWTTESTTSVAATVNTETNNVNNTSVTPTSSSSNLTVGKTNIGGGAEVTPPTSIVNGNSYANIAAADGNLVIGVNNDNMTWTFSSTNRAIYGKTDEHITIAAVDDSDDDYGVRQIVVDGAGTIHSRTQLQRDEFRIGLDFEGIDTSWTFNPTTFQVPSYIESSIYSFGGNLNLYAMNDGSNGVARLQSVSFTNGPNVFSQFEATPTSANVKVYNGGSNGGTEHVWTFGADGKLTLPTAVFAGENSILPAIHFPIPETSGGYVGVTNNGIGITANNNTWMFEADGTTTFPNNTINQPASLLIKSGEDIAQVGSTMTIATDSNAGTGAGTPGVVDVAYDNTIIPAYYYPGGGAPNFTDSTITFANGDVRTITSIVATGGYIEIAYDGTTTSSPEFPITLKTGNYAAAVLAPQWTFGTNGNLTLPAGGDIKDSTGTSVLGGGGTTLPADASGYLNNNGSGTLTWVAGNPAGSGILPYSDVKVFSATATGVDWQAYTLSGTMDWFNDYQGGVDTVTLSSQPAYGTQIAPNTKALWINDAKIDNQNYVVIEFPAIPALGDVFNVIISTPTDTTIVTAGSFIIGQTYVIESIGEGTNWPEISGSNAETVGATFVATGPGSGTGTASTSVGATKAVYKLPAGHRARTMPAQGGYRPAVWFGQGGTYDFMYAELSSLTVSGPLLTFVYAGLISGIPSWYQVIT